MTAGIGGTGAHVLARSLRGRAGRGVRPGFRPPQAVVDGMRARGLIGADGWLTAAGRQTKERVEALTDELAARPTTTASRVSSTS